ncbi:MAG: hypothetical protein LRZ85_00950 [Alphaproteobacteria bacterium]|nr:hypothetical protein [Alphaproteobacteria bacterium]MCD8525901.1 hypothetical protein [Alphaproteobacteria bacterium]MCD8570015.1 hypothetical protein [Alphaproteobacteria bacterium]
MGDNFGRVAGIGGTIVLGATAAFSVVTGGYGLAVAVGAATALFVPGTLRDIEDLANEYF